MVKRVCAWCQKDMGFATFESTNPRYNITHGICQDCKDKIMANRGKPLDEFIGQYDQPIYLVDEKMVVQSSNKPGLDYAGKPLASIQNIIAGQVFECIFSNENGCGNHIECSNCTLRDSVNKTFNNGVGVQNQLAEMSVQTDTGIEKKDIAISTEKVGDIVFLQINNSQQMAV